jgi:hypothetical protein
MKSRKLTLYAECHYADCLYADCHGAKHTPSLIFIIKLYCKMVHLQLTSLGNNQSGCVLSLFNLMSVVLVFARVCNRNH